MYKQVIDVIRRQYSALADTVQLAELNDLSLDVGMANSFGNCVCSFHQASIS